MLLHSLTATTDYLAQVGPNGVDAPPGADKYQLLMNIGLWVATGLLAVPRLAEVLEDAWPNS